MSKSKGNVVAPDEIFNEFGADTARFFILSDSPPQADFDWKDSGVEGCFKFMGRVWRLVTEHVTSIEIQSSLPAYESMSAEQRALYQLTNKTIAGVTEDIESDFQFNTVISKIREFVNGMGKYTHTGQPDAVFTFAIQNLLKLLAPIAPHIAEELWHQIGYPDSVHLQAWPTADAKALTADSIEVVVQVNGKLRDKFTATPDTSKEVLEKTAMACEKIQPYLDGKAIVKVIVVPGKLVNIVVK